MIDLKPALVAFLFVALGAASVHADDAPLPKPPPAACGGTDLFGQLQQTNASAYAEVTSRSQKIANGEGLLWKIEKPGRAASYLFGTIHATDDGAVALARSMDKYVAETRTVVTELGEAGTPSMRWVIGAKAAMRAMSNKIDTSALIDPADRDRVGAALRRQHLDPAAALRMPPWMLVAAFALPPCELERQQHDLATVDQTIIDLGTAHGLKIVGLETIDEQLDALASIDPGLAAREMVILSRRADLVDDVFATMVSLYRQQRIGALLPANESLVDSSPQDVENERKFLDSIVTRRNHLMARRAEPMIDAGPVFIAVGALHLVGDQGLVQLLRTDGYAVTNVR